MPGPIEDGLWLNNLITCEKQQTMTFCDIQPTSAFILGVGGDDKTS